MIRAGLIEETNGNKIKVKINATGEVKEFKADLVTQVCNFSVNLKIYLTINIGFMFYYIITSDYAPKTCW